MKRVGTGERVKNGAKPLLKVGPWLTVYRDIELIPPRPPQRCSMCGNVTRAFVPVFGGWLTCTRCTDVIRDRTRNMAHGEPLLRKNRTLWNDGGES